MGSHGISWRFWGGFPGKSLRLVQVILIFLLLFHINRKDASLSINGMCWEKGPSLGLILLDLVAFHPKNKSKGKDLGIAQTVPLHSVPRMSQTEPEVPHFGLKLPDLWILGYRAALLANKHANERAN